MDVVVLNGKEYQKASAVAKKFKYTTDYVGQLCRQGKVDAQLVGRSWYVNIESISDHKKGRYSNSHLAEKKSEKPLHKTKSRIEVEPVLTNRASKVITEKSKNFAKRIDWKPIKYEYDDADLLPEISTQKKLKVELANSSVIKVKTTSQNSSMEAEPLPEVELKGNLKIDSIEDVFSADEISEVSKDKNSNLDKKKELVKASDLEEEIISLGQEIQESVKRIGDNKEDVNGPEKIDPALLPLTPESIKKQEKINNFAKRFKIIINTVTFLLVVVLFMILFFDFTITATSVSSTFKLVFNPEDLQIFFSKLP